MSVIDLQAEREKREPHITGSARCLDCKHEWVGVAPVGVTWMECPECTLQRGRFFAQCAIDEPHWHCNCGCDLFYATADGFYCPNCGAEQSGI